MCLYALTLHTCKHHCITWLLGFCGFTLLPNPRRFLYPPVSGNQHALLVQTFQVVHEAPSVEQAQHNIRGVHKPHLLGNNVLEAYEACSARRLLC